MSEVIPEDIRQFLLKYIDSVAQWEALLLLRNNPAKTWSAETVARHIYVSEQETLQLLDQLAARNILLAAKTPAAITYRYQPKSPEDEALIGKAAELYRRYLIPMTTIIHSKSKSRVQEFADAFKLRKD